MKDLNMSADAAPEEPPLASVEARANRSTAGQGALAYDESTRLWGILREADFGPAGRTQNLEPPAPDTVAQPGRQITSASSGLQDDPLQGTPRYLSPTPNLLQRQRLENEQYIVLGRLTAHLCHSINNSLQALRGALTLALEEPDVSQPVVDFVHLCQGEVQREATLVDRIRQVYRPNGDAQAVHLEALLDDVVAMTSEEAERLGIEVHQDVRSQATSVRGSESKLRLIFLSLVLRLMDLAVMSGRRSLRLRATSREAELRVEMSLEGGPAGSVDEGPWPNIAPEALEGQLALSAIRDLASAHGGELGILPEDQDFGIWVTLPT